MKIFRQFIKYFNKVHFLNDGEMKSLKQGWEEAKNRSVTKNLFQREEWMWVTLWVWRLRKWNLSQYLWNLFLFCHSVEWLRETTTFCFHILIVFKIEHKITSKDRSSSKDRNIRFLRLAKCTQESDIYRHVWNGLLFWVLVVVVFRYH